MSCVFHPARARRPGRSVNCPNMVQTELAEYHLWAWRKHSSTKVGLTNAEIRTGERMDQLGPLQLPLLSSRRHSGEFAG